MKTLFPEHIRISKKVSERLEKKAKVVPSAILHLLRLINSNCMCNADAKLCLENFSAKALTVLPTVENELSEKCF